MCINARWLLPVPEFMASDPICVPDRPEVYDGGEYAVDETGRRCFVIDACLAPALEALWARGIKTTTSCCGHGTGSGVIGIATEYNRGGKHLMEAPPYQIIEVVERRRHENAAYRRGRHDAFVAAGREDLAMLESS